MEVTITVTVPHRHRGGLITSVRHLSEALGGDLLMVDVRETPQEQSGNGQTRLFVVE